MLDPHVRKSSPLFPYKDLIPDGGSFFQGLHRSFALQCISRIGIIGRVGIHNEIHSVSELVKESTEATSLQDSDENEMTCDS